MTIRRTLATAAASLLLLVSLTACFGIPALPTTGDDATVSDIAGTSWSGTDSDGDFWAFEFQADGTLAFSFNEDSYDDASDVWTLTGDALHLSIAFSDGEATFDGSYVEGASSVELVGKQGPAEWTVTITRD